MSATIPSQPPSTLRAGDSAHWTRSLSDYPASAGWALAYTLINSIGVYGVSASAFGDDYDVAIPASGTAGWVAGRYTLVEYVTKGSERITLGSSVLVVTPDLAAAGAGVDTRSHAAKVLDRINAWLETGDITAGEFQFADRRIRQYGVAELLSLRDRYAAMVAAEDAGRPGMVRRMLVQL